MIFRRSHVKFGFSICVCELEDGKMVPFLPIRGAGHEYGWKKKLKSLLMHDKMNRILMNNFADFF